MPDRVSFVLDGRPVAVDFGPGSGLTPTTTVLQYLRALPRHRGVKEGCAEGDCGACTVVLAEPDGAGLRYEAVDSCLLFLPMLHRRQLITVANLKRPDGVLHPVQQAMVDGHGSQCGFCTPGIVMSLFALYKQTDRVTEAGIRSALAGNLCRCTGYRPIIDAARAACDRRAPDHFTADEGRIRSLLEKIPEGAVAIFTGAQRYLRPSTLREALGWRREYPEAVVVNGATDIALRVTKRHEQLPVILDLSAVREMKDLREENGTLIAGAGVTMQRLQEFSRTRLPVLSSLADSFGSLQIRNMATLGGNIGTASPVGDTLPLLMACDARVVLAAEGGERIVPANGLVVGYRRTACSPGELIAAVRIPIDPGRPVLRWYKVSRRRDVDIATVSGGFRLELDAGRCVRRIVLAYGGMADRTKQAAATEAYLTGKPWTRRTVEKAMPFLRDDFQPISDVRGSAEMRMVAAGNMLLKFWDETHA